MKIIVDDREPNSIVKALQGKEGLEVEVKRLKSGDYLIPSDDDGTWAFERKTQKDFQSSWWENRLHQQLMKMMFDYAHPCIIFEDDDADYWGRIDKWKVEKHLRTLNMRYPVVRTSSERNTVTQLYELAKSVEEGRLKYLRVKPELIRAETPVEEFYCALPGVSLTRAKAIAKVYPTPVKLINAMRLSGVYDPKKWKTKTEWRRKRWDRKIEGISDGFTEIIYNFIFNGQKGKVSKQN